MESVAPTGETIPSRLKYWSTIDPETPAFIFIGENREKREITRGDLFDLSGKMAAKLKKLGIKKGDAVATMMENSPERLILEFGLQMLGAVSHPDFDYCRFEQDMIKFFKLANISWIILDPRWDEMVRMMGELFPMGKTSDFATIPHHPDLPNLKMIFSIFDSNGDSILDQLRHETDHVMEEMSPKDPAITFQTSGTTGFPKLVTHSHAAMTYASGQMTKDPIPTPCYCDISMGWLMGYPLTVLNYGLTTIIPDIAQEKLPSMYDVIVDQNCRSAVMTINGIHEFKEELKKHDNSTFTLDRISTGGQPLRKSMVKEGLSFAKCLVYIYAMTETFAVTAIRLQPGDEYNDFSVGHINPKRKLKFMTEDGVELPRGEKGMIYISGPFITEGRSVSPTKSSTFSEDGWLRTGDMGYIGDSGMLYVEGRGADAILHGDEILYPHWMEGIIRECPVVDDAALIPVRDSVKYQEICACLTALDQQADGVIENVKKFIDDRFANALESQQIYCIPTYYVLCQKFPVNRNGKVDRKKLRETAEQILEPQLQ